MKTRLGRVIILVDDYEKAFDFYERNFFCKKIFEENSPNGQRLLHIAFSHDDNVGIWFLKPEPGLKKELSGGQTAGQPTLVIYTDDIEELYYHIQGNGVRILEPLANARDSRFFHCLDLYGNRLTVVQL